MRLTDNHISENELNTLIEHYEKQSAWSRRPAMLKALLELKQRRAEDRASYFKDQSDGH